MKITIEGSKKEVSDFLCELESRNVSKSFESNENLELITKALCQSFQEALENNHSEP